MGRIERQIHSDQQVIATFLAAGAEDLESPTFDAAVAEFDEALASPPVAANPKLRLLRELGVA